MEATDKQPLSILVAEDTLSTRRIICRFLEMLGYQADAVENGFEAVKQFELKNYDLVLMDIQMPGMDGITATDKIKQLLTLSKSPFPFFVAQTTEIRNTDESRYHKVGFDKTILKPTTVEKLRYCIELAIQRKIYIENLRYSLTKSFAEENPLSVLVVDDEALYAGITTKQLEILGYKAEYMSNGYDVIDAFSRGEYFDLILMDIRMPHIDGFKTTDLVRETLYNQNKRVSPTIIASTTIEMLKSNQGYREGMFDSHLIKPLDLEKLAHALYVAYQRKLLLRGNSDSSNIVNFEKLTG